MASESTAPAVAMPARRACSRSSPRCARARAASSTRCRPISASSPTAARSASCCLRRSSTSAIRPATSPPAPRCMRARSKPTPDADGDGEGRQGAPQRHGVDRAAGAARGVARAGHALPVAHRRCRNDSRRSRDIPLAARRTQAARDRRAAGRSARGARRGAPRTEPGDVPLGLVRAADRVHVAPERRDHRLGRHLPQQRSRLPHRPVGEVARHDSGALRGRFVDLRHGRATGGVVPESLRAGGEPAARRGGRRRRDAEGGGLDARASGVQHLQRGGGALVLLRAPAAGRRGAVSRGQRQPLGLHRAAERLDFALGRGARRARRRAVALLRRARHRLLPLPGALAAGVCRAARRRAPARPARRTLDALLRGEPAAGRDPRSGDRCRHRVAVRDRADRAHQGALAQRPLRTRYARGQRDLWPHGLRRLGAAARLARAVRRRGAAAARALRRLRRPATGAARTRRRRERARGARSTARSRRAGTGPGEYRLRGCSRATAVWSAARPRCWCARGPRIVGCTYECGGSRTRRTSTRSSSAPSCHPPRAASRSP